MERQFIISRISDDRFIAADKTGIDIRADVAPSGEFTWDELYRWLSDHGATPESLMGLACALEKDTNAPFAIADFKDEGMS